VRRKAIFLLLFGLAAPPAAYAQKFQAGLKTGLNISTQRFSGNSIPSSTSAGAGFHAGAFGYWLLNDRMGIQAEVLFSIQQFDLDYSGTKYRDQLTYINIPLLLRYKVKEKLSAHTGFQLGFLTGSNEESGGFSYDTKSAFTNGDLGFVIGGTIELPANFNATLRYTFGIKDVDKFPDTTTRNGNFQASIGYKIFGRK
jgi:hypothetical protein